MRVLSNTYTNSVSGISDDLVRRLSSACLQDTSIKDQLTHAVRVIPGDGNDINEQAFKAKHAAMPLLTKVQKALRKAPVVPFLSFEHAVNTLFEKGELSSDERATLLDYDAKRKLSVRVDEFTFDMEIISLNQNSEEVSANAA